ncbi:DUF4190 domain-containing protein [Aeromicrobium sp. 9AM]|uniref:DUF4190 domain-containing protein n=1 Tax=Aeromicrobium sp. 9AM TaxID=2653126 RepID=UPI0012F2F9C4|nr:DUF4190 domain-containing protein [Aeromicrobium sp. 9AM]VXB27035.1 conserved hypothetical protein [Aeromicrobium sp. 9AM]
MTEQQPPRDPLQPPWPAAGQPYPQQPYPGQAYSAPQGAYPPPSAAPSKAMAITALVLAIFGFFVLTLIAAVILAIIVLVRSKDGRPHGKGMAISALIISVLWVAGFVIAIVAIVSSQPERDSSGQVVEGGHVLVGNIRTGDCLTKEPSASTQLTVELTPCSKPHREEAFANFDLGDGDFPGQPEVDRLAEAGCVQRYEDYVGVPADSTELVIAYLRPFKDSWKVDPEVTCLVSEGGTSTGSLKGANR